MKRNLFLSVLFVLMFAPAHAQQVNILSYNVHNCIGMDKEYNYQRIANVISQTSPDIVALQEPRKDGPKRAAKLGPGQQRWNIDFSK